MSLAASLSAGLGTANIHFPEEDRHTSLGELWDSGKAISRFHSEVNEPIAMVLSNTASCVSCLLGSIRAGLCVVSLPLPSRGMDLLWYQKFIESVCSSIGARRLILDAELVPLIPELAGILVFSYDEVLRERGSLSTEADTFRLIQFTSGSTSSPKGVILTQDKILANIEAILDRLEVRQGDGACSWLPLSHDMGLIGMTLSSFVAAGLEGIKSSEHVILTPTAFLKRPSQWLEACSNYKSTFTCTPNFGLEMAMRKSANVGDLSNVRVCIVGGEPVRPSTLSRFEKQFEEFGFSRKAFCPAYGLAEAALAVTLTSPDAEWEALSIATSEQSPTIRSQIVSAGQPLAQYEVVGLSPQGLGELLLRGPSLAAKYSDGTDALDNHGWFHTSDLGLVLDSNVYIAGRMDDVFEIAGRNIYAIDVESSLDHAYQVHPGRCVAVKGADDCLVVIAELDREFSDLPGERGKVTSDIRRRIVERGLLVPSEVVLVANGTLPMTSSGKIQRKRATQAYLEGDLEPLSAEDRP